MTCIMGVLIEGPLSAGDRGGDEVLPLIMTVMKLPRMMVAAVTR